MYAHIECLGMIYQAEPIPLSTVSSLPSSPIVHTTSSTTAPLEQLTITFTSPYYLTPQGLKKLQILEAELIRLARVRHASLCALLAIKLGVPQATWGSYPRLQDLDSGRGRNKSGDVSPRLVLLMEGRPRITLEDVMEECERMKEERARDYLVQILNALKAVHAGDLVHRGVFCFCLERSPYLFCVYRCLASFHRPWTEDIVPWSRIISAVYVVHFQADQAVQNWLLCPTCGSQSFKPIRRPTQCIGSLAQSPHD